MKALIGIAMVMVISGCSTIVTSERIKQNAPQTSAITGITYSLPKRLHKLKVSAKLEDTSDLQGKLDIAIQTLKNSEGKAKQLKQTMDDLKRLASNTPVGNAKDDADKLAQTAECVYK